MSRTFRKKVIPLDNNRLWFLSVFKNNTIIKYSFDVEKVADSHYELVAEEYNRLAAHFGGEDTIEALKHFIKNNSEHDFVDLLDGLEVFYSPFHYD